MNIAVTRSRTIGFTATAMAAALLVGCTTHATPTAAVSASKAETALASGKYVQAIAHAETAVLAEPHNAALRAVLGSAYLDAGRFASAATSFHDAMQLGDGSPRTVLSLALARMGEGRHSEAATLLNGREGQIATADLGLALALAGQPERGIRLMGTAIRGGENTAKMRQNLAYAYALAGQWREARLMAAQDVPADKVSDRVAEWAEMARPEAWQHRVAALLQVPIGVTDSGQPVHLALSNPTVLEQLATDASALPTSELNDVPVFASTGAEHPPLRELPPLTAIDPSSGLDRSALTEQATLPPVQIAARAQSSAKSESVAPDAQRFVQSSIAQSVPPRGSARPAPTTNSASLESGNHLVQLGSFSSEQGARRASEIYLKKYPDLASREMIVTEAVVRGKRYWRVSAAGFGLASATALCGRVRAAGAGCFAWTEGRPLPGAVDTGVRLARR